MNKTKNIICFSLFRFDSEISSTSYSLAREFAKSHKVYYINHPYSWKDFIVSAHRHEVWKKFKAFIFRKDIYSKDDYTSDNLTIVTTKLTLPINFLPKGFLYNIFSSFNTKSVSRTIKQVIKDHSINDYIFINFYDPYFLSKIPEFLKPTKSIYHCFDDITQVLYSDRHGSRLENECIRNYDLTLCTSMELTRLKSSISPKVHFLPNAADNEIFSTALSEHLDKPYELVKISVPIIGFIGSIEYRTDFDLLAKIAVHHSDKMIILIGPIQTRDHLKFGINKLSNVLFLGSKNIHELPAYLKYFDCAIIPFVKSTLTKSIYPLKINEYLAAGKPVISTDFSEDIKLFNEVAYIANSHEDFISAIDIAIHENSDVKIQERLTVAKSNSWATRAIQFWDIVEK